MRARPCVPCSLHHHFVRIYEKIAGLLFRIPQILTGILPVLLPSQELTRLIRNHYDDSPGMWRRAFPIPATNVLGLTRDLVGTTIGTCQYQPLSRVRHPSPIRRRHDRNLSLHPQSKIHILLPVLSVGCYSRRGHEVMPAFSDNLFALWINPYNTPPR